MKRCSRHVPKRSPFHSLLSMMLHRLALVGLLLFSASTSAAIAQSSSLVMEIRPGFAAPAAASRNSNLDRIGGGAAAALRYEWTSTVSAYGGIHVYRFGLRHIEGIPLEPADHFVSLGAGAGIRLAWSDLPLEPWVRGGFNTTRTLVISDGDSRGFPWRSGYEIGIGTSHNEGARWTFSPGLHLRHTPADRGVQPSTTYVAAELGLILPLRPPQRE